MFVKKFVWFLIIMAILWSCVITHPVHAEESSSPSHIPDHAGKSYSGTQDPSYLNYDSVLRKHMIDRIRKRFGVVLDPKIYSGFDLLEIEALFKCKKSEESFDLFLKMFPRYP